MESLIIRMTKSHMPKSLIKNKRLRSVITSLRRQEHLRSLMRIDGENTTFTPALVEKFPCVQGLD